MRNRVNDYYLKNGGLDLTILDQTETLQKGTYTETEDKSIKKKAFIDEEYYEGRYISLKKGKIPSVPKGIITDNLFKSEEIKEQEIKEQEIKEQEIKEQQGNSYNEVEESIKPYMSEEIHNVLKEMGEYLLENGSELAATLTEKTGTLGNSYNENIPYYEVYTELEEYNTYALEMSEGVEGRDSLELEEDEIESLRAIDRQSFRLRQYELLKGKILTDDIISSKGEYIGRQGEMITHYMIQLAEEKKCMIKMIMHSK